MNGQPTGASEAAMYWDGGERAAAARGSVIERTSAEPVTLATVKPPRDLRTQLHPAPEISANRSLALLDQRPMHVTGRGIQCPNPITPALAAHQRGHHLADGISADIPVMHLLVGPVPVRACLNQLAFPTKHVAPSRRFGIWGMYQCLTEGTTA